MDKNWIVRGWSARCLNASCIMAQRLTDRINYQRLSKKNRRFLFQKTCSNLTTCYNTCRKLIFNSFGPKEKTHYCATAHCRPHCCIKQKNLRYYDAKAPLQCRSPCKGTSWMCFPQRTTEKGRLMLGKITRFLDQTAMGFCALPRRAQIHTGQWFRTFADLEETKKPDTINPTL